MPLDVKIPNTSEIDQALKEFEVQSSEQVPEQMTPVTKSYDPDVPKMVQLVIKLSRGSIKNQKQAEYVLLGIVALMFVASLFLFFGAGSGSSTSKNPGLETFKNAPAGVSTFK